MLFGHFMFLAAKCSTKNYCVSLKVSPKLIFLTFTQKIFRQPLPENLRLYSIFLLRMPLWKNENSFTPSHITFGTPSKNYFFALIKKIFLQTLVKIIFRYQNFFFRVLGPPGTPYEQNEHFYIWGVGYQNRVKRVGGVHFWRNAWKIFKNKDVDFQFFLA